MSWQMDYRLGQRNYSVLEERSAFRAGYADGFHKRESRIHIVYKSFPNAYAAGYNEGLGDSHG